MHVPDSSDEDPVERIAKEVDTKLEHSLFNHPSSTQTQSSTLYF